MRKNKNETKKYNTEKIISFNPNPPGKTPTHTLSHWQPLDVFIHKGEKERKTLAENMLNNKIYK